MRVFFLMICVENFSKGLRSFGPSLCRDCKRSRRRKVGGQVADRGNPASYDAAGDAFPIPVRELCHDLLDSAATIGLLAQVADAEAAPAVAPDSQLPGQLRRITTAASQVTAICAQVLDEFNPSAAPVLEPQCDPDVNNSPWTARYEGGPAR
jgi:hypothetical protein